MAELAIFAVPVIATALWAIHQNMKKRRQIVLQSDLEKVSTAEAEEPPSENDAGRWGLLDLQIDDARPTLQRGRFITTYAVSGGAQPMVGIMLRRRSTLSLQKVFGGGEEGLFVGDHPFDVAFEVDGAPTRVRALLDQETRQRLRLLDFKGRVSLSEGVLSISIDHGSSDTINGEILSVLREAAERMTDGRPIIERLSGNALTDGDPEVRSLNLIELVREFGAFPRTKETLRQACSDADPEVRFVAGSELAEQGFPTLRDLVEGDTPVAAKAMHALGENLPLARAPSLLREALAGARFDVVKACVQLLGRYGGAEVADVLVPLLSGPVEVAISAVHALAELRAPLVEEALIETLRADDIELRLAVADALAHLGSVAAVLPLRKASDLSGEREFVRAARQAIAAIQSRVPGEAAGRVSLAETVGGEVSLAESETGKVSLMAKKE